MPEKWLIYLPSLEKALGRSAVVAAPPQEEEHAQGQA